MRRLRMRHSRMRRFRDGMQAGGSPREATADGVPGAPGRRSETGSPVRPAVRLRRRGDADVVDVAGVVDVVDVADVVVVRREASSLLPRQEDFGDVLREQGMALDGGWMTLDDGWMALDDGWMTMDDGWGRSGFAR